LFVPGFSVGHKGNSDILQLDVFFVYFVLLDTAGQHSWVLSGGIGYMVCPSL